MNRCPVDDGISVPQYLSIHGSRLRQESGLEKLGRDPVKKSKSYARLRQTEIVVDSFLCCQLTGSFGSGQVSTKVDHYRLGIISDLLHFRISRQRTEDLSLGGVEGADVQDAKDEGV